MEPMPESTEFYATFPVYPSPWWDNSTWPVNVQYQEGSKPETLEERVERLERELQQLRREMREIALPRIYDLESRHPPRKPLWAMPKAPYEGERNKA